MSVEIKIRRHRLTRRQRTSSQHAIVVALCPACTEHFGVGYGPLEGAKLGAVVRFHRTHGPESLR